MTRPARPGDICVVVHDPENLGKNVGKQLHCDRQCACDSNSWACTTLEPFVQLYRFHQLRHAAGVNVCCRKQDIIPLLDPDKPATTPQEQPNEVAPPLAPVDCLGARR